MGKWDDLNRDEKKEGINMSSFKPIQATPELCGEDAKRIIKDVLEKPKSDTLQKNEKLISILKEIRGKIGYLTNS